MTTTTTTTTTVRIVKQTHGDMYLAVNEAGRVVVLGVNDILYCTAERAADAARLAGHTVTN